MSNDFLDFEPLDEEAAMQNKGFPKLEEGVYTFKVIEANPGVSHSGNKKIDLTLTVIHDGQEFKVWDTLVGTKNMIWKLRHFCEATGLMDFYNQKRFSHSICLGKTGKAIFGFQPERPNPNGGVYKSRNTVEDYCGDSFNAAPEDGVYTFKEPEFVDSKIDDLPF